MKVSREFQNNFKKVCQHYQCTAEEVEEMKDSVRRNYEAAKESFAAMAEEIGVECGNP